MSESCAGVARVGCAAGWLSGRPQKSVAHEPAPEAASAFTHRARRGRDDASEKVSVRKR